MAIKKKGIALLVTVIFMSVMLSFGVALASLSYKQSVLATTASASGVAFFAADAALECALYADQRQGAYIYSEYNDSNSPDPATLASYAAAACDGSVYGVPAASWTSGASGRLYVNEYISFNDSTCARVTIYKYGTALPGGFKAFIFSEGYNTSCAVLATPGARVVARGIYEKY